MILEMHQANMDIQFVLDPYACCVYIVDYINKSDKSMSKVFEKVLNEGVKDRAPVKDLLTSLAKKYYNTCEISAQEAAYNLLQLRMTESSSVVIFVPTGMSDTRSRFLKSKEALRNLDGDSTDIYCKGMTDYYTLRPDTLEKTNLASFFAFYQYQKKRRLKAGSIDDEEEEIVEDGENEIVANEEEGEYLALKDDAGFIRKRKKARIIKYCRPSFEKNKDLYFHHIAMLYHPWRNQLVGIDEKDCRAIYLDNEREIKNAMAEFSKIEDERIDEYVRLAETVPADNEDTDEQERCNDEPMENSEDLNDFSMYVDPEENALDDMAEETGQTRRSHASSRSEPSATVYVRPDMMSESDYERLVSTLNEEQRDALDYITDHVRYKDDEPIRLFITGGAGTGKSLLIKALYQTLIRHYDKNLNRDLNSQSVLLCAPTGKAAFNIQGMTLHSAFHLPLNQAELQQLSSSVSNSMAVDLVDLKVVIIDEISMVSSRSFLWIDQRLRDIFLQEKSFGGKHVILLGDFWQLPPVHDSTIFDPYRNDPLKRLKCIDIWNTFKVHYLTTIMR